MQVSILVTSIFWSLAIGVRHHETFSLSLFWLQLDMLVVIRFDAVHSRMETYLVSDDAVVYHMEMDKYVPGNVLFVNYCSIKTTNGHTIWDVVGRKETCKEYAEGVGSAARFSEIRGFHQVNSSHVIVTDTGNHCIRLVNRDINTTASLAGSCGGSWNYGFQDGVGRKARFLFPISVMADVRNEEQLLITDRGNHAVRQIRAETGEVSTFFNTTKASRFYPKGITQDSETGDLYMTSILNTVHRLGYDDKILTTIAGNGEGSFMDTRFYIPEEILIMENNTKLVVTDSFHAQLKVLDLTSNSSISVCDGSENDENGNLKSCSHPYPKSLMLDGDTLYVGTNGRIRTIKNYDFIRRMQIRSQYHVECDLLSEDSVTETNLQTLLNQRMIETVCRQYCDQPRGYGWRAKYFCVNDTLTITWPTTTVYTDEIDDIPKNLLQLLNMRLDDSDVRQQLKLTVATHNPPIILPRSFDNGLYGKVILSNTCLDTTQSYNADTDSCEWT